MTKVKRNILITLVLAVMLMFTAFSSYTTVYSANTDIKFDDTNVLDDLKSSTTNGKAFNILDYPFDSSGIIKHPQIINVVEYCYSYKVNMQSNYGLYLYFYNPQGLYIKPDSGANKVQIAISYSTNKDGNIIPSSYEKYNLQFCNVSTEPNYYKLFYKFKLIDKVGTDGKKLVQRVNSNVRRYDVSGIELHTEGETNASEYTVGGTYNFSGYAKGYGADSNAESNLACDVRNLETIRLDLSGKDDGVDKRTYWRSNSSSVGAHHQNQINSVFFAIDKTVLEKFGYVLQKIKAEWWEYKTRPTVVIDDLRIFNKLLAYNGVSISENYDRTRGWTLYNSDFDYISNGMGGASTYDWSWNAEIKSGLNPVFSKNIETLLPLLFYTGGIDVNDYTLLPETLEKYFNTYSKSYVNGHLKFNEKDYSSDLFADSVDNGRTLGYNLREFDRGNPDDYWDIRSYDKTHNWWNKLWDYGFGSIKTNDDYADVPPIQMLLPQDMSVSDLANHLKINLDDVNDLKNYYNSVKKNSEVFIFRYAQTDYWAENMSIFEIDQKDYGGTHHEGVGEIRQGTQFFDFDILEFTFNKDGNYTVIPIVSSPIDHISGYTPSIEPKANNWWKLILGLILLVLLFLLCLPFLSQITGVLWWFIKGLLYIVCLPFNLIGKLFKINKNKSKEVKK